ncbi:MAG: hypothetical protein WBL06_14850, partial [Pseudolysinimonas sp.]|uniref:hypothetical protein n=1 Tax=Pseudolysinimonas sp. TaxID=2680009 RepID=UPI003C748133
TGTPTGEVCDGESGVLTLGSILVAITPSGGATVEYRKLGDTTWIPVGSNPITGLAGGTYEFKVATDSGYTLTTPSEFTVVVPSDTSIGCDTLPLVVPQAFQDPGCELPSFFTISNDLSDPAALSWTANGDPIAEGKHVVNGPIEIKLVATANGPDYGISAGVQKEWTFTFPSNATCGDLETLALTGSSDTTPALALMAFLGLLGLAMVRSGIRANRIRQAL